jgi:aspartyl-tRNA(Asn)/glutamyl-tRNA(Gln) amidotransferase subunit A|tara:strand:- start:59086 stop:60549 length:1464 start_codon:yes stop_codon:yes gene_type:complete
MHNKTIREILNDLASGQYSSREITSSLLDRIKKLDPELNSFISLTEDQALAAAESADSARSRGEAKGLCGVPIAHKDIFCTKGVRTSAGSKMLDNFVAPYDATLVKNVANSGAVCLGKTNMDEFAMGSSNETSYYGPVKNPWDTDRVPGGSSGGSAAAVAARLVPGATATDTGGSIRQPSSLCGVTGVKPTYGRVSRYGMIAFASSLDQAGPIARTAEDCALLLESMAGFDPMDSTCIDKQVPKYSESLTDSIKGLRIGLPKQYFNADINSEVGTLLDNALNELKRSGANLVEVDLPHAELAIPTYYVVAPAECSTNLSRYDGVRYGYRCEDPKDLKDLYCRSRSEAFGDEVKRRILVGTYVLSAGFYDAYYRQAQKIRRLVQQDYITAFEKADLIASPAALSTAFKFGEKTAEPVEMYQEDLYTIPANLAGLPAMSMPCGLIKGLPIGMQFVGRQFEEARMLNAAHQYQMLTDWHTLSPSKFGGAK